MREWRGNAGGEARECWGNALGMMRKRRRKGRGVAREWRGDGEGKARKWQGNVEGTARGRPGHGEGVAREWRGNGEGVDLAKKHEKIKKNTKKAPNFGGNLRGKMQRKS